MICEKCHHENNENNKFCMNCGMKLNESLIEILASTEDNFTTEPSENGETLNKETAQPEVLAEKNEQLNEIVESDQEESVNQTEKSDETNENETVEPQNQSEQHEMEHQQAIEEPSTPMKKSNLITILGGVAAVFFLGLTAFMMLWESDNKEREVVQASAIEEEVDLPLEAIYMQMDEVIIYPNQLQRVDYYVYPEQANTANLRWKSSNPDISVNESGYIFSVKENSSGVITLSDETGEIQASMKVNVGKTEEIFQQTMAYIHDEMESGLAVLDYNKEHFFVGKNHDESLIEENVLKHFQAVEENINNYAVVQKQFINSSTKNLIDVDVYMKRGTNEIHKIVAIEHMNDERLKISDYYFDNGKLGFYFDRYENYYRPVAARQDFPGVRAYIFNDALLRYRDIVAAGDGFEKTDYSLKNDAISWELYTYEDIDKDDVNKEKNNYVKAGEDEQETESQQAKYYTEEQNIVNAGYNLYSAVVEQPALMKISGYVAYPDAGGTANITVKIFSEKMQMLIGETVTDADGYYELVVPQNQGDYRVFTHHADYVSTTIYNIDSSQAISNAMQETIYLFSKNNHDYAVHLNLVDAISGSSLYDLLYDDYTNDYNEEMNDDTIETGPEPLYVNVIVRSGINNKNSHIVYENKVNIFDIQELVLQLAPGNYTVEININGYEKNYFTLSTVRDGMQVQSNIVPKITGNEMRVVLTWLDYPSDLDSHLFFPDNGHLAYYNSSYKSSFLDVDDTDGYGPETITIKDLTNGTYKYYVADFSNLSADNLNSYEMSNSFARVDVYSKNGTKSFTVPRNTEAVIWQVFNISNGQIVPIQRVYNNVEDYEWWSSEKSR